MKPDFRILADRQDITARIRDRLLSLRITDEAGIQSDTVEILLDDRDGRIEWPAHGVELEVFLGDGRSGLSRMGLYVVDEVEHSGPPSSLTIRGKAADMRAAIKAPRTRSWHGSTVPWPSRWPAFWCSCPGARPRQRPAANCRPSPSPPQISVAIG